MSEPELSGRVHKLALMYGDPRIVFNSLDTETLNILADICDVHKLNPVHFILDEELLKKLFSADVMNYGDILGRYMKTKKEIEFFFSQTDLIDLSANFFEPTYNDFDNLIKASRNSVIPLELRDESIDHSINVFKKFLRDYKRQFNGAQISFNIKRSLYFGNPSHDHDVDYLLLYSGNGHLYEKINNEIGEFSNDTFMGSAVSLDKLNDDLDMALMGKFYSEDGFFVYYLQDIFLSRPLNMPFEVDKQIYKYIFDTKKKIRAAVKENALLRGIVCKIIKKGVEWRYMKTESNNRPPTYIS